MTTRILVALSAIVMFASCAQEQTKSDIIVDNLDTTVRPQDDFFEYAVGGWIKQNPIPNDETSWGIAHLVQNELYDRLKKINEDALAANPESGTDQQIADFWFSGMDTASIEEQGIAPLKPELEKIAALSSKEDVIKQIAAMHKYGVGVFYGEGVSQDAMNSEVMAYWLWQGGLGLPNRDYYFNTDERTTKIRDAYPEFIANLFVLIGEEESAAQEKANSVLAFETSIAEKAKKLEELRDPYANYNKMAISDISKISPNIDWAQLLKDVGVHSIDSVIVGQPEFVKQIDKLIATSDIQVLKDYMSFHLVRSFASYLSNDFVNARFDFYSKTIYGAKEMRPRWKRVLRAEEDAIGEALGQLFAKEYFNETAKKRYEDIVENVRDAYKKRIETLDWMTDETKEKAQVKLASISKKIGYPDKWKDFSTLKIDRGAYALNMMRSNEWWNDYEMNKLGKPVDRSEWGMTPQTYNAYYNPSNNEIVMPAGIFTVPGYRDEELDDAIVYGLSASSTIGHEITHGFDDEGRKYDADGNLKNWWTEKDGEEFEKRAQLLVDQFNAFTPIDTMHINGTATLGENLADLGGVLIGLDAFKQTEMYKNNVMIGGFTPTQRFFLGYALGWMYQMRDQQLASRLLTDVHSPAKYRVNGPFPNVPEFYEAFDIKEGDGMYLADSLRVDLW